MKISNVTPTMVYTVQNKNKKTSSPDTYNLIVVEDRGGKVYELLFTEADLVKARIRAKSNAEDIPDMEFKKCDPGISLIIAAGYMAIGIASGVLFGVFYQQISF